MTTASREELQEQSFRVQRDPWTPFHRIAFRFIFCFVALYTADLISAFFQRQSRLLNGDYPAHPAAAFTALAWQHVIPWVGLHLLHLRAPVASQHAFGQDSPYEYILRGTEAVIALVAALIWTVVDRTRHSRQDHLALDAYLRIFVRGALCVEMLFYGLAKVPPAQFGMLSLYRLARPLGEMWPMAMLWAFMATSPGYTLLSGLVEAIGGLLLLARRTTMLGALISAAAMANVLALNIFYDVNQKIRCAYYLLLAIYLAAPQLPGLWRMLILKQQAAPAIEPVPAGPPLLRRIVSLVPLLLASLLVVHFVPSDWYRYTTARQTDSMRGPNYGIWSVTLFRVTAPGKANNPLLPADLTQEMKLGPGEDRWRSLILDAGDAAYLQMGNGEYDQVEVRNDSRTGETLLVDSGYPDWLCRLRFHRTSAGTMTAEGTVNGSPVQANFTLEPMANSRLLEPPHWVSEGRRW